VMPASVGYDMPKLKECLVKVATQLGHPRCVSGKFCYLAFEAPVMTVDDKMEVHNTTTASFPSGNPVVTLRVPEKVNNSLDLVILAINHAGIRTGCQYCHSGFDINFASEVERLSITVDSEGNIAP